MKLAYKGRKRVEQGSTKYFLEWPSEIHSDHNIRRGAAFCHPHDTWPSRDPPPHS